MNICRTRNWLANYSIAFMSPFGFGDKIMSEKETDIGSLIFWGIMSIVMTLIVYWWLFPIHRIYDTILRPVLAKKYKCDNY